MRDQLASNQCIMACILEFIASPRKVIESFKDSELHSLVTNDLKECLTVQCTVKFAFIRLCHFSTPRVFLTLENSERSLPTPVVLGN